MIFELQQPEKAAALFAGWQETMIWSCLQGVMGKIYADSLETPVSAMASLGDFRFLAGTPDKEFLWNDQNLDRRAFRIAVPQNTDWEHLLMAYYGERAHKVIRYAIKKEPDIFCRETLQAAVNGLPDGYTLQRIDEPLFWQCRKITWCKDWTAQYKDYAAYQKHGMGVVILKDGEPVSGASSYSGYSGGIEIEIDTREDYRRRGLAYICGAKLILECLECGWYPSWDAQNKWSVALAKKLGYHFDHAYTAYEIIAN